MSEENLDGSGYLVDLGKQGAEILLKSSRPNDLAAKIAHAERGLDDDDEDGDEDDEDEDDDTDDEDDDDDE